MVNASLDQAPPDGAYVSGCHQQMAAVEARRLVPMRDAFFFGRGNGVARAEFYPPSDASPRVFACRTPLDWRQWRRLVPREAPFPFIPARMPCTSGSVGFR